MALHFVTHPWEVQDFADGILVQFPQGQLEIEAAASLVDDLTELVLENGQSVLYLDLAAVHTLPALVVGKLFALDRRLRTLDGRLVLWNLSPHLEELLQRAGWSAEQEKRFPLSAGTRLMGERG